MADGSGLNPGGKPGELELSSPPNPGGNPSGGSHRQDPQPVIVAVSQNRPRNRRVNPPVNFPEQEIENVLWIESSPKHCAALKEWDRLQVYLTNKVDRKEKRSADLTNQIFNIFGFFSVFQGVVLTAVSQLKCSTTPLCGMVWIPSLLSSVALGVAIIGVSIKFSRLQKLEINIKEKKSSQKEIVARATKLRAQGKNFDFSRDAQEGRKIKSSSWLSISRICVILSLVIFTGLFILSYVVILCNSLAVSKWNKHLE